AITLIAEIQDFRRFRSPRELAAFVGLIPSEYSSGGKETRGAITKTGNSHARRIFVEAAWHYRHPFAVRTYLRARLAKQRAPIVEHALRAQRRLNARYRRLIGRGKRPQVAVTAVARELVGFVWALANDLEKKAS